MKLIVTYDPGQCYEGYKVVAIEYESEEALYVALEEHCNKFINASWDEQFDLNLFECTGIYAEHLIEEGTYCHPKIQTLESWWEEKVQEAL